MQGDFSRTSKENSRTQFTIEGECRELSDHGNRAETIHFEHKITQDKEREFDGVFEERHQRQMDLVINLKNRKEKELAEQKAI